MSASAQRRAANSVLARRVASRHVASRQSRCAGPAPPPAGSAQQPSKALRSDKFTILEPWNDHTNDPNFTPTNVVWIDDLFGVNPIKYEWRVRSERAHRRALPRSLTTRARAHAHVAGARSR